MPFEIQMQVGPQVLSDGVLATLRGGKSGELIAQLLHGKYYEQVSRGRVFSATNQAAQAVSAALATTYTGLCVSNPLGNLFNLVMLYATYVLSVAPAAIASLHLIGGYSPTSAVVHTTPLVAPGIQNMKLGIGPLSTAKADSAATIVNPGYLLPLMGGFTAATLPSTSPAIADLGGMIVVPPGGWIALGALTAVTGFGGLVWEEEPA